jgi:hypothetical protein
MITTVGTEEAYYLTKQSTITVKTQQTRKSSKRVQNKSKENKVDLKVKNNKNRNKNIGKIDKLN